MYLNNSVAVVVPCKNEAAQIRGVINGMPPLVDLIVVIDDGSTDGTADVVRACAVRDPRVQLIRHEQGHGVGGAIAAGYVRARDLRYDVAVVMAGDGQMAPADLEAVVYPVAAGLADYCKGNRFKYPQGLRRIPPVRKFGNFVLSVLTKIATGYWHVSDTQTGYTAISLSALEQIDVEEIYPTYGCPNDILAKLSMAEMRVTEVPINPLYNVGENSKMRIGRIIGPILSLLSRSFARRVLQKGLLIGGEPFAFTYIFFAMSFVVSCVLAASVLVHRITFGEVPQATLLTSGVCLIVSLQFLLAAFCMDSDANRHLCVHVSASELAKLKKGAASPSLTRAA